MRFNDFEWKEAQVPPVVRMSSRPGKFEAQLSGFLLVKILIYALQRLAVNASLTSSLCHRPADTSVHTCSHFPTSKVATNGTKKYFSLFLSLYLGQLSGPASAVSCHVCHFISLTSLVVVKTI